VNPDDFARAVTGRDDLGAWSDCLEEAGRLREARVLRAALRAGKGPYPLRPAPGGAFPEAWQSGRAWGWYPPIYRTGGLGARLPVATFDALEGFVTPDFYAGRYYATCGLAWAAYLVARLAVRRGRGGVGKGVGW
jgi:hypothetical protein